MKRAEGRPGECRPFRAIELFPLAFAMNHDVRVNSEGRIVDEHAAVYLGYVNWFGLTLRECAYSSIELLWDTEVFGEMIQCAERQHAHDFVCACELAGNRADCAIAARRHDRVTRFIESFPDAGCNKSGAEFCPYLVETLRLGTGRSIQDDDHPS